MTFSNFFKRTMNSVEKSLTEGKKVTFSLKD